MGCEGKWEDLAKTMRSWLPVEPHSPYLLPPSEGLWGLIIRPQSPCNTWSHCAGKGPCETVLQTPNPQTHSLKCVPFVPRLGTSSHWAESHFPSGLDRNHFVSGWWFFDHPWVPELILIELCCTPKTSCDFGLSPCCHPIFRWGKLRFPEIGVPPNHPFE